MGAVVKRSTHVGYEHNGARCQGIVDSGERFEYVDIGINVEECLVAPVLEQIIESERFDGCIQFHDRVAIDEPTDVRDADGLDFYHLRSAGQPGGIKSVGTVYQNDNEMVFGVMLLVGLCQGLR
ncbi:MAG: hypothetical protein JW395_2194 [Nitrospira sp.]|nr:hypothetical protein [Nitrospira sp.]